MSETWRDLSEGALRSAEILLREGQYRSCVSRAYYAAYCAATGEIVKLPIIFAYNWSNPPHAKVPVYIANNFILPQEQKNELVQLINSLRLLREDADYRPNEAISEQEAKDCVRDAVAIQNKLWGSDLPGSAREITL